MVMRTLAEKRSSGFSYSLEGGKVDSYYKDLRDDAGNYVSIHIYPKGNGVDVTYLQHRKPKEMIDEKGNSTGLFWIKHREVLLFDVAKGVVKEFSADYNDLETKEGCYLPNNLELKAKTIRSILPTLLKNLINELPLNPLVGIDSSLDDNSNKPTLEKLLEIL
ncbi:MAG TPA: hypothetical protein VJB94_02975 [Candidatus Nanoarchaeia archaeon]|nr:hypothetical protein [Candidatus Nanoarchaeia archaeon]